MRARAPRPAVPTSFSVISSIDAPIVPPSDALNDRNATKPKSSPLERSRRLRLYPSAKRYAFAVRSKNHGKPASARTAR